MKIYFTAKRNIIKVKRETSRSVHIQKIEKYVFYDKSTPSKESQRHNNATNDAHLNETKTKSLVPCRCAISHLVFTKKKVLNA